jgi:hypothetical protein
LDVDGKAVVHRDDLDLAGGVVLHRMVRAVVALVHLFRLAADGEAEHLMAEADAKDRNARLDQVLMTGTAYSPVAAGSPGPFDRKMPSGFWRQHCRPAGVVAGTTVTLQPRPAKRRRMLRFTP